MSKITYIQVNQIEATKHLPGFKGVGCYEPDYVGEIGAIAIPAGPEVLDDGYIVQPYEVSERFLVR